MRRGWRLGLFALAAVAVGGGGVVVSVVSQDQGARSDDGEDVEEPALAAGRTPLETVTAFYDAVSRGDCETADALRTELLLAWQQANGEERCRFLADEIRTNPDRVARLFPEVTDLQVEFESDDVARVSLTFDFRLQPDAPGEAYLIRQTDGSWKLGTIADAIVVDPASVDFGPIRSDEDVVVFLDPTVTDDQRAALETDLSRRPEVASFVYVDRAASEEEFRRLFADNPMMLARFEEDPEVVPTSYRLDLTTPTEPAIEDLVAQLDLVPGVMRAAAEWSLICDPPFCPT